MIKLAIDKYYNMTIDKLTIDMVTNLRVYLHRNGDTYMLFLFI